MLTIILLSVAGAVLSAIVGTFWYSNATPMGRIHMRYLGFDKLSPAEQQQKMNEAKPMVPKRYGMQLLLSFLTSFAVVFIVTMSLQNGLSLGMAAGFVVLNWFCFMVPVVGSGILWGTCDGAIAWKKFFSDNGANLVTVLLIALMTSLFV